MHDEEYRPRRKQEGGGWHIMPILFLALIAGGVYWFWTKADFEVKRAKQFLTPNGITRAFSGFFSSSSLDAVSLKEKGGSLANAAFSAVIEKPKAAATDFISSMKKAATESVRKEAVNLFGIPVGTLNENANVSIIRPVSQSLSFMIDAADEDLLYSIDWGDKTAISSGSVLKQTQKVVSHAWAVSGDYSITVELVGKNSGKKSYSFPMTIQK